jgi:hypothetical protein
MKPNYETSTSFGTTTETSRPREPQSDVAEKQDKEHSEADFLRDLDKATQQKPAAS